MADGFDHLKLRSEGSSAIAPRRYAGIPIDDRNHKDFADRTLNNIRALLGDYSKSKTLFPSYDQDLLFRMRVRKYHESTVKKSLKSHAKCQTIITRADEDSDWVVLADDANLEQLQHDINSRIDSDKPTYVGAITEISGIAPTEKFGSVLRKHPLGTTETASIIVTLLKKPDDLRGSRRKQALDLLNQVIHDYGFKVYETFISKNLCQVLVQANSNLLTIITHIDYVHTVDRPPEFQLSQLVDNYTNDKPLPSDPPSLDAHGILVLDTGVIRHPLLDHVIKTDFPLPPHPDDHKHHGTCVSGMAAYASLDDRIESSNFIPEVWICSAQLLYDGQNSSFSHKLPATAIEESLKQVKNLFPQCRVVNISIVALHSKLDNSMQLPIAMAIDDLSAIYPDVVFVIATGNNDIQPLKSDPPYPNYLFEGSPGTHLLDPATSAHAITVGSIKRYTSPSKYFPSSFTRVGPGLNDAVKPELVDVGGDTKDRVAVLNPDYFERWFQLSAGTSFSTPIVANFVARLMNKFPTVSRNLIIALLLSSATLPTSLPQMSHKPQDNQKSILRVYGYGKPNLTNAIASNQNRVVFTHDGMITIGTMEYFSIRLPDEFFSKRGMRIISVTLVFDPPCDSSMPSYMGISMEFNLHANQPLADVKKYYSTSNNNDNDDSFNENEYAVRSNSDNAVQFSYKPRKLDLIPGPRIRGKTNHQKGVYPSSGTLGINSDYPLILAVSSKSKWDSLDITQQRFSVVITIEHQDILSLYEKVKSANPVRARVQ